MNVKVLYMKHLISSFFTHQYRKANNCTVEGGQVVPTPLIWGVKISVIFTTSVLNLYKLQSIKKNVDG